MKSYKLKLSPQDIFSALKGQRHCFFLDTSLALAHPQGRYSFFGIDPFYILETKNQDPFPKLRQFLEAYRIEAAKRSLPLLGGAVGYLAYDLGFILEKKLRKQAPDDLAIPDCFFGFYNTVLIADNLKKLLHIFSVGFPERKYHLARALCAANLKKIQQLLVRYSPKINKSIEPAAPKEIKANFSKQDYLQAVKEAKDYIRRGEIYQVNLSQRFESSTDLSAFEIYQRLRRISPSYFSAYFDAGDFQILSSSPERFLNLRGRRVITRPMKGTRPRGLGPKKDAGLKRQLLSSPKDKAELTMIVDLERNDLGRVCDYDSIRVKVLREIEEYNTVYQTTSTIEARLYPDKDRIDLLRACFPGGSITGCPKIRAMEIIEELEPHRRSIYTGALGYLSFSGDMDFNILIRTILKKQNRLYFGVGGGIVADSKPESEYAETLVKAEAMIKSIS